MASQRFGLVLGLRSRLLPLIFSHPSHVLPAINRDWLNVLVASSNSGAGLIVTMEPATAEELHPRSRK
jgi:hypothetical protein